MPTFDAAASTSSNSATSLSWNHTVTGSDAVLIVAVGGSLLIGTINGGGGIYVSVDGVPMWLIGITNENGAIVGSRPDGYLFGLPVAAGVHTINITGLTAGFPLLAGSLSFTGVSGIARWRVFANGGTGASTSPSVSVTTGVGEVVVAVVFDGIPAATITSGGGLTTPINIQTPNTYAGLAMSYSTQSSNAWTLSSSIQWATLGVSLKPVGAVGTPPVPALYTYEEHMSRYGTNQYNRVVSNYTDWQAGVDTADGSGTLTSSGTTVTFSQNQSLKNLYIKASGQTRLVTAGAANQTVFTIASAFSPDITTPTTWRYTAQPSDFATNWDYYDGLHVFYHIADYLGSTTPWYDGASKSRDAIIDGYYTPNDYGVPGFQYFVRGPYEDFVRLGTAKSKTAVNELYKHAAYSTASGGSSLPFPAFVRENAYGLTAAIFNAKLGFGTSGVITRSDHVENAYGHLKKWFIDKNYACSSADELGCDAGLFTYVGKWYYQPFMGGLVARSLIEDWDETGDSRAVSYLQAMADFQWTWFWREATQSFCYQDDTSDATADPVVFLHDSLTDCLNGAPDLNLLIAPLYAWLALRLHDESYMVKADQIFQGGVLSAGLDNGKQFNQSYTWSFDYLTWRAEFYAVPPVQTNTLGSQGSPLSLAVMSW
jgi:hypothetical protein